MSTGDKHPEYNARTLVDHFLETAGRHRASDIHIEPREDRLLIRFRIDGRLKTWKEMPLEVHQAIISRLKIMGGMDIAERRLSQDGRFSAQLSSGKRDFRLSTVPQLIGEKAVIRMLHQDLANLDFSHIGYNDWNLKLIKEMLAVPHGLVLHCGPTGSGKTTALYAAINYLSEEWRNIQTIEDPVEGQLAMANQAQVNADIGLTFASLLRSILRQDCDVILVGEIRDTETAQLAVQASLTGHLVLGTIHSNSAAAAITRLCDMGVSEFFVGTALVGVVSQRLVRRLCRSCRKPYQPSAAVAQNLGLKPKHRLYATGGCRDCDGLGYRGRIGIQEVLRVNQEIRDAIHARMPARGLSNLGEEFGMITILRDGIAKAVAGRTTVEEVVQVVEGMKMDNLTVVHPKQKATAESTPPVLKEAESASGKGTRTRPTAQATPRGTAPAHARAKPVRRPPSPDTYTSMLSPDTESAPLPPLFDPGSGPISGPISRPLPDPASSPLGGILVDGLHPGPDPDSEPLSGPLGELPDPESAKEGIRRKKKGMNLPPEVD